MLYTVYRTVNLTNGKYYLGVHKTNNPNDKYFGSGNYIRRAIAKYGEEGFRKDILFTYLDPESAFAKEDELIQCYRGLDPLCMNLRKGGSGGFDWINKNSSGASLGGRAVASKRREKPELYSNWVKAGKENLLKWVRSELCRTHGIETISKATEAWRGGKHTLEWKTQQSKRFTGANNPNFGKKRVKLIDGSWLWVDKSTTNFGDVLI